MTFYRNFLLLFILTGSSFSLNAQTKNGAVSGKVVISKDKLPIDYASVAVKNLKDSTVAGVTSTKPDGSFIIKGLGPGTYRLSVAYLGLQNLNKDFTLTTTSSQVNIGVLTMINTGLNLKTVEIVGAITPIVVKTDTVEYNAGAFKVRENAVVEDVLKKLPGVEVAKDGSVKAQGEKVTRVRVDGKDFFGNDPLLATKNLPADMIDKIQVIDLLSDQSQFTGVDDGNREKIINITTKKDMKHGYFGNSSAGGGTDGRYDANINVNKFKNEQQFSVIGQFNNINSQGFGDGNSGGGRRDGGNSGGAGQPGITTTSALGVNFTDIYTDDTKINGSYFFNRTKLDNQQNSFRQNLLGDGRTTFDEQLNSQTDRKNHRFNLMIDTKLDSSISIRIQPNISYTETGLQRNSNYVNNYGSYVTTGTQTFSTVSSSPTVNNNLLLRKKFSKAGRTLSLNVNTNINDNDAKNYNDILNNTINGTTETIEQTRQLNDQNGNSISNTSRLVYTEPLNKTLNLEVNYQNMYRTDRSERMTFNFNPLTNSYDIPDFTYTNTYENRTWTNTLGTSLNKKGVKYTWNVGVGVQHTDRSNENLSTGNLFKQNFYNFIPTAQLRYTFNKGKKLTVRYRGNTQQPSINQIQPILDNSNTQTIAIGNPDLKPAFSNNLMVFYNNFDFAKFRSLFVFANFSQTLNAFGNSSTLITDESSENFGKIQVLPVNVGGVYQGSLGGSLGLPIIKGNKLNLNIDLNGDYSRGVNLTNSLENITNDFAITNKYRLVSSMDKLDLNVGIGGSINRATYSAQPSANTTYYTLNPTINVSYLFPGDIRLAVDMDYYQNTGRGEGYDTKYTLLNSYVSKQFFNNRGTFKFAVNDILNQNQGVFRTSSNNTITDLRYNVLKRYAMFSFTYSLSQIGGKKPGRTDLPEGRGGMQGSGGYRGGGRRGM